MALTAWKKRSESVLFKNLWWTYKRDELELPNGKFGEYHYVHTNGSSMVIPIMSDGKILTVKQYRYLCGKESIEFPCGSVKDGSSYDETVWQELAEETGYSAKQLSLIGEFNPYNGVTDEMCHVYVAREMQHVGATPDETEEFELLSLSVEEVDKHIRDGIIWDGMSIAGWSIVKQKVDLS
jgi:ADP-ribose pyrophosphatase